LTERRTLPNDIPSEQAVIGSLLYDNSVFDLITCDLNADDFYHGAHRIIYTAVIKIINQGQIADLITVSADLSKSGMVDRVGGAAYIASLAENVPSPSSIAHYAKIVKEKSIERKIISEASRIIEAVYDNSTESNVKLEDAQKAILNLSLDKGSGTLKNAREIAKGTIQEIEDRFNNKGSLIGYSTGLFDLDSILSGLVPSDLIIIAGRPGMGKSALAGCIAANVAESGIATVIFSLEMSSISVMTRIFANRSKINSRHLRSGYITDGQWPVVTNVVSSIANWPLHMDDKPDVTPEEIRAKARKLKKESDLGLLIVDYIQLVRSTGKHDSREQAVSEISRTLKAIARELNIPVIALSQLNRQVDARPDKHPVMSDLRESGAIEQDADTIIFVYRDEIYNKSEDNPKKGIAELIVAKQRNGETGPIEVVFDAKTQTFMNLQKVENAPWNKQYD
jgi:replicative DNA helicase